MAEETHDIEGHAPIFDMKAARDKFRPIADTSKKGRAIRHKAISASVDRRTLTRTGRTAQFNFKSTPGLHARVKAAAERKGQSLAEWMEEVLEAKLAADQGGGDA
jgi:hypothetical protein